MNRSTILSFINLFIIVYLIRGFAEGSTTITIANRCSIVVYPAIVHVAGTSMPFTTGFSLKPGESKVLTMSDSWLGEIWARTYCSTDSNGVFSCLTGKCHSSTLECDGRDPTSPATFTEFNLNTKSNGIDYSSVSVENGYNLPIMVQPQVGGGSDGCLTTSCMLHLNKICPLQLKIMRGLDCIGCKSTGKSFSKYSESFKKACPRANVNTTETIQGVCPATNYVLTFCPRSDHSRGQMKRGSTGNNIIKALGIAVAALVGIAGAGYAGITIIRNINKIKQCCIINCFNCCNRRK